MISPVCGSTRWTSSTVNSAVVLRFGQTIRPKQQRQHEGPMVRPSNWYFPAQFVAMMEMLAKRTNQKNGAQYISQILGRTLFKAYLEQVGGKPIVGSVEAVIQGSNMGIPTQTRVKSLIGARQILQEWVHQIESAKKYVQISLYDFDNLEVKGGRPVDGADFHDYWYWQQIMLQKLIDKAHEFKKQGDDRKIQIILDASKEQERNEYGFLKEFSGRRYQINNEGMVAYLRNLAEQEGLPIEVVHYPRELAKLYHVKLLVVDGVKAIIGGMNMSNHSPANWDACVALSGPEVANLQLETFHQDWVVARYFEQMLQGHSYKDVLRKLKTLKREDYAKFIDELPKDSLPVSHPGIKVMNTIPKEYEAFGFKVREEIGDYLKQTVADPALREILGEQFILTHKALTQKMIARQQEGSLQLRLLHSLGVVSKFPATRRAVHHLQQTGGENLFRFYKENKETQEKLHAKLMLMKKMLGGNQELWEVFIGSANVSKVGLETNVREGRRADYPNTDETYQRGNREVALVIPSNDLARPFVKQFDIDWKHSDVRRPSLLGSADLVGSHLKDVPNLSDMDPAQADALLKRVEGFVRRET